MIMHAQLDTRITGDSTPAAPPAATFGNLNSNIEY